MYSINSDISHSSTCGLTNLNTSRKCDNLNIIDIHKTRNYQRIFTWDKKADITARV